MFERRTTDPARSRGTGVTGVGASLAGPLVVVLTTHSTYQALQRPEDA